MKGNLLNFIINTFRKFTLIHLHWMSFDIAAGAMILQSAFNRIPAGKTSINSRITLTLGLGVFIISSLNRLLDNRKPAKTETKRFLANQKERISFLKIIAGALFSVIIISLFLPEHLWKLVLSILICSGLCLFIGSKLPDKSILHSLREPVSAILLASGILGTTYFLNLNYVRESKYIGALILLLVFQNFLLSSYFQAIEFPGTSNLVTLLKASLSKQILHGVTFLIVVGCIMVCFKTDFRYTQRLIIILMSMSLLQSFLLYKAQFLSSKKYKGLLVTLILILPFLVL